MIRLLRMLMRTTIYLFSLAELSLLKAITAAAWPPRALGARFWCITQFRRFSGLSCYIQWDQIPVPKESFFY